MTVSDTEWSKQEQEIAQKVFEKAYMRETSALIEEVRQRAGAIAELDEIWRLHDFLSARRHDLDGKYDYRYSVLIFVFARLIEEGWLHLEDLEGLDTDKLTKVSALARM
jgi:Photoprotection regulator fluorescence recovery protein